jgi:excisionase family DNA binding protein
MTKSASSLPVERLLTVGQAAELLGTTDRFPRRLIEERRIRFVRIGRHVRIPESALREFIDAGLVEPVAGRTQRRAGLWATAQAGAAGSARFVS